MAVSKDLALIYLQLALYLAPGHQMAMVSLADLYEALKKPELAIKVSCVGEALSLPALTASHRGATQPLARAVLERLRHDEGPHAAIGPWFLEWAEPRLTQADREHLGRVASEAVAVYEPLWLDEEAGSRLIADRDGKTTYREYMERSVNDRIVNRLATYGIGCLRPTRSES